MMMMMMMTSVLTSERNRFYVGFILGSGTEPGIDRKYVTDEICLQRRKPIIVFLKSRMF